MPQKVPIARGRPKARVLILFGTFRYGMIHAIALILWLCGCHPLPPGDIATAARCPAAQHPGNVVLLRGWRDLYSTGIDDLTKTLNRAGVNASVYRCAQWRDLAQAIGHRNCPGPLILIGFSYGADDSIEIARQLQQAGQPVDLLITIDPVTPPLVPANVKLCYNYFQTNGVWDLFPWLRGIPLKADGASRLINVDIRAQRPDLLEPDTAHSNIAANPKLHREIVQRVLEVWPPTSQPSHVGDP